MRELIEQYIYETLDSCPIIPHRFYCSACGKKSIWFKGYGVKDDIFEKMNIIGGGYRKNVYCPKCKANDRMRWIDYVLKKYTGVYSAKCSILHIAPEEVIENKIRKNAMAEYITGDICEGFADQVVDITNMPQFETSSFDYVIVNHVLEHVENEKKALNEIYRVLKEKGKFVFSMPIAIERNTFESEEPELSPSKRLELYGQTDHYRLYGRDVKEHIASYGFKIDEYIVDDILNKSQIKSNRLMKRDRVFIGTKF